MARAFLVQFAFTLFCSSLNALPIHLGGPAYSRSSPEHVLNCSQIIPVRNGYANLLNKKFEQSFPLDGMTTDFPTSGWVWKWSLLDDFPGAFIAGASRGFEGKQYFVDSRGLTVPPQTLKMLQELGSKDKKSLEPSQKALISANEIYQISQISMTLQEPTFEEYAVQSLAKYGVDISDPSFQPVVAHHLANKDTKASYRAFLTGPKISSTERLQTLKRPTEELAMFSDGVLTFSNEDYTVWLSRSASAAVVCLPESQTRQGMLNGRVVKKALFDFSVKANGMKFLTCESVLIASPG